MWDTRAECLSRNARVAQEAELLTGGVELVTIVFYQFITANPYIVKAQP